jgi:hypothetical protein
MMIDHLPPGSKGFDCNDIVTAHDAACFVRAGYTFAIRYVRRSIQHPFDLSAQELATLLRAGLAVSVVQHVADPGWLPNERLGRVYGAVAAEETARIGVALGTQLWCDLEGVHPNARHRDVVAYCNAWYDAVRSAGYDPGQYVGDSCGLDADELFHLLKVRRFWAAYNLNSDAYPAVRGACMRQHAPRTADLVPGIAYPFDVNVIGEDALHGAPMLMLADGTL